MRKIHPRLFCILLISVLILSACNLPGNDEAAVDTPTKEPTAITATIEMTVTQAPTETATTITDRNLPSLSFVLAIG